MPSAADLSVFGDLLAIALVSSGVLGLVLVLRRACARAPAASATPAELIEETQRLMAEACRIPAAYLTGSWTGTGAAWAHGRRISASDIVEVHVGAGSWTAAPPPPIVELACRRWFDGDGRPVAAAAVIADEIAGSCSQGVQRALVQLPLTRARVLAALGVTNVFGMTVADLITHQIPGVAVYDEDGDRVFSPPGMLVPSSLDGWPSAATPEPETPAQRLRIVVPSRAVADWLRRPEFTVILNDICRAAAAAEDRADVDVVLTASPDDARAVLAVGQGTVTVAAVLAASYPDVRVYAGGVLVCSGADILGRHERSIELMRSWLTPAQREQFDGFREFDVVGEATGDVYTLRKGVAGNVLRRRDRRRFCFGPEGIDAVGDVMLAQKMSLETDERAALRVANDMGRT